MPTELRPRNRRGLPKDVSKTVATEVRLREMVLGGEFHPGEAVSENVLGDRLGVSRTPLRLALCKLEYEGLLNVLPEGGFVVRQFTLADIYDSIELRGVLEGTAARLAAERLENPSELRRLEQLADRMDVIVNSKELTLASFADYVDLNASFHEEWLELAKSPTLEKSMEELYALPFTAPSAFIRTHSNLPEAKEIMFLAQDHHRQILEAIRHREGTRAESLARAHSRLARRKLRLALDNVDIMKKLPGASLIKFPHTF
jgi:GntR family transcriptional regulator of vanillate catabolism